MKSAVLLAGLLAADGPTTVVEPRPTRDHTESLLAAAGARVECRGARASVWPADRLQLGEVAVPGDFSSAAPLVVAATLVPGSELHLHGVNLNPRRTGLLAILERMGARVTAYNRRRIAGEAAGDLEVRSAELVATDVGPDDVAISIDELPLFALAASCAHGDSVLRGAEELRAKESDRIEATTDALRALGQHVRPTADGFRVRGVPTRPRGGRVDSRGDHRIAMLGAVAGLASAHGRRDRGGGGGGSKLPGLLRPARADRGRVAADRPARDATPMPTKPLTDDGRTAGFRDARLRACIARGARDAQDACARVRRARRGDRGDRRAGRSREEQRRAQPRRAARLPLPRHGGDVPGADVAGARAGHAARRRAGARVARA